MWSLLEMEKQVIVHNVGLKRVQFLLRVNYELYKLMSTPIRVSVFGHSDILFYFLPFLFFAQTKIMERMDVSECITLFSSLNNCSN